MHIPLHTVTVFCYYQFYCFQDTANLFSQFDATLNNTILDFLNTSEIQSVTQLICTETSVLRDFIDTQLPWFEYQEYTWLAVGTFTCVGSPPPPNVIDPLPSVQPVEGGYIDCTCTWCLFF